MPTAFNADDSRAGGGVSVNALASGFTLFKIKLLNKTLYSFSCVGVRHLTEFKYLTDGRLVTPCHFDIRKVVAQTTFVTDPPDYKTDHHIS